MKFVNWFLNKLGVFYKLLVRLYWDVKLSHSIFYFSKDTPSISNTAYKTQSVDYLLLIEALKLVPFDSFSGIRIADVGCGAGRLLAYLNSRNQRNIYTGYEINHNIAEDAKKFFSSISNVNIILGDVLEEECNHDFYILFNPFPSEVFSRFLRLIGKRGIILYINASDQHVEVANSYEFLYEIECVVLNRIF